MNKSDFEVLQLKFNRSGMTLKSFLGQEGISYSTYNYWSKKTRSESESLPVAPISISESPAEHSDAIRMGGVAIPGVTLAFPNGLRAHFGNGSEKILMEVLSKSMGHVQP